MNGRVIRLIALHIDRNGSQLDIDIWDYSARGFILTVIVVARRIFWYSTTRITRKSRVILLYDAIPVLQKLYQSVVAGFIRGFRVELFLFLVLVWPLEKRVCALEVTEVHNEEERRFELLREEDDKAEDSLRRTEDDAIEVDDSLLVES